MAKTTFLCPKMSGTPHRGQNGQNEDTNDVLYSPTNEADGMWYCNPMDATVANSPISGDHSMMKFNLAQPAPGSKYPTMTDNAIKIASKGTKTGSVLHGPSSMGEEASSKAARATNQQTTVSMTCSSTKL